MRARRTKSLPAISRLRDVPLYISVGILSLMVQLAASVRAPSPMWTMYTIKTNLSSRRARGMVAGGVLLVLLVVIYIVSNGEDNPDLQSYETHMKILATRRHPVKPRTNSCNRCNDFNFKPIIEPKKVCGGDGPIDLLVFVTTIPKAVQERAAIRDTWGRHSKGNTASVRHVFLFGGGWNQSEQAVLNQESSLYGDILQEDYKDAYYNLSLKMISGYGWALKHCARAHFTLRTADDNYVNVPHTLQWVRTSGAQNLRVQIGHIFWKMEVYRQPYKKWYVSYEEFPERYYPPYAVGTAFLYSMAAVRELVDAAPSVPFFAIEDAWFGMVMREIKMAAKEVEGFDRLLLGRRLRALERGECPDRGDFFGMHLVQPDAMYKMWRQCPSTQLVGPTTGTAS